MNATIHCDLWAAYSDPPDVEHPPLTPFGQAACGMYVLLRYYNPFEQGLQYLSGPAFVSLAFINLLSLRPPVGDGIIQEGIRSALRLQQGLPDSSVKGQER